MIGVLDPTTPRGAKIQLRNLSRRFGGQAAVDDISLDVPAGSFVSLLGPSGSGKTTTLNLIAGFLAPDAGDILFDDRSVTDVPPHHRDIGMVFQSYALFPHLEVARKCSVSAPDAHQAAEAATSNDVSLKRWRWCEWRTSAGAIRANCLADSSSGWRWRGRWFRILACY